MSDTIRGWQERVHALAVEKGWWASPRSFGDLCTLLHSEVSEAFEQYRDGRPLDEVYEVDGKPEGVPVELADLVIRVLDLCGGLGIDLQAVLEQKHTFNMTRPHRHGGKRL